MNPCTVNAVNESSLVTNGLVSFWDFGNPKTYPLTGSILYDLSANKNNQLLYKGVCNVDSSSVKFDSSSSYTSSIVGLTSGINGLTFGIWYNAINNGFNQISICSDMGGSSRIWFLELNDFTTWNVTNNRTNLGYAQPAYGTWNYILCTYDSASNSMKVFLNGTLNASSTSQSGSLITVNNVPIVLGFDAVGLQFYASGSMGLAHVYNRALSQSEITQNYSASKGRYGL